MPRIYDEYNDPWDFCADCWQGARGECAQLGVGHAGDSHPDYDECNYKCDKCGKALSYVDN